MKKKSITLIYFVPLLFLTFSSPCYGLDSLMTQRLSVPRAGDIYLIQEPNDSFSFFQIGNTDTTDLVPIIKGAYMVEDSFLLESIIKRMETHFPDYFDTSDIIFIPRNDLHRKNREGLIKQIYRMDKYEGAKSRNTTNFSFYFYTFFLFSLVTAGFVCLYYLVIWLLNLRKIKFRDLKEVAQLGIIISIVTLVSVISILDDITPFDSQELMFLMIRNLGVAFFTFLGYNKLEQFIKSRLSFWKQRFVMFIGLILIGTILLILAQIGVVYLTENRWEFNTEYLFEHHLYNFNPTFIFFNLIPLAIANTIYTFIGYQKRIEQERKQLELTRLNQLKTKAELEALTAKTNPHFLYNSLNTIAALAKIDADKTEKMAIELSKFLKYSTNRQRTNLVPLKEEIEMIETYLRIEKIRFEDQLTYQIVLPKNAEGQLVPRFLLQPLIENALKHGYQKGTEQIAIAIETSWNQEQLMIKIKDSGPAFSENFTAGYGLDSVTRKLQLLFPYRHHLEFINTPEKMIKISLRSNTTL